MFSVFKIKNNTIDINHILRCNKKQYHRIKKIVKIWEKRSSFVENFSTKTKK